MKRLVSLGLLILMVFSMLPSAYAGAPITIQPRESKYFSSYSIIGTSPATAQVRFTYTVTSVGVANTLGVQSFSIERKNSDGSATTVYTDGNNHYQNDVSSYTLGVTYEGTSGRSYRSTVTYYCKKSGLGSSTFTMTSSWKEAK